MGKVTYEFDENKESRDIELIVNRYKMICALDELEKYRHDLYNGHCEDVIYVRDDKKAGIDENKTIGDVKRTKECIEVKNVLNVLDNILEDVKHLVSL